LIEFFFLSPANIFPLIFSKTGFFLVACFVSDDFIAKPSIEALLNDGMSILLTTFFANTLVELFCRETISILGLKFTDGRNFFNAISTDVSFFRSFSL